MEKYRNKLDFNQQLFWIIGTIFILLFMLMSFDNFTKKSIEHTFKVNENRLREFSGLNAGTFKLEMEKASGYMKICAEAFSRLDSFFDDDASAFLKEVESYGGFYKVWIAGADGKGYDEEGGSIDISYREYFQRAKAGESGISDVLHSAYNQQDVFCVYTPIVKEGQIAGVLIGAFAVDRLTLDTANTQFSGKGYAYVFDREGKMIIHSDGTSKMIQEKNIWDFFAQADYRNECCHEEFRNSVESGKSGIVYYQLENHEQMGYYEPVGINDWYMFSVVREDEIMSYSDLINQYAFDLVAEITLCFFVMTISVILYVNHAHKNVWKSNYLLKITNQRFRIAVDQLVTDIVQYDLRDRKLIRIGKNIAENMEEELIHDLKSDLIKGREIEQESLSALFHLLEEVVRGSMRETCIIKAITGDGLIEWYKVVFTNTMFKKQPSDRAIGTIEDMTKEKETEIQFAHEEQQRKAMLGEIFSIFVANLTKGKFVSAHGSQTERFYVDTELCDEQEIQRLVGEKISSADKAMVEQELSLERLKSKYLAGLSKTELEFRNDEEGNAQRWLKATVNFVVDPESKDVMAYFYLADITQTKLSQLALIKDAERDGLTGLYNRHTARKLIREFLAATDLKSGQIHAFILLDLDRFKHINDTYGHLSGDFLLEKFGKGLEQVFRQTDILGRFGGDEFVIFVKYASSVKNVEKLLKKVNLLLNDIRLPQDEHYQVTSSSGVCIVPHDGTELRDLYQKSDIALYAAKKAGRNCYKFYSRFLQ